MTILNLEKLFKPQSVAVIGATNREGSVGRVVMRNLLNGGFEGPIMPVNPKRPSVAGVLCYPDVGHLPLVPDLAVICTPPKTVPNLIGELGERGTRAAIVLTSGLNATLTDDGRNLQDIMAERARAYDLRLLGPNCLGLIVPHAGLNASFSHLPALSGRIAFVSQSGALCTAVLDWARAHGIGFSHFASLGDCADIDFGDVIDYLGSDPSTRAILLYIESIKQRRNFMSAARAASRNKPILVLKSGRFPEGAKAAATHTGALAGSDEVYDSAIRRAGMLRVFRIGELFAAVETLARARPVKGERLAIMTNGGGIGVMAVDELVERGGRVAELSESTLAELDKVLPSTWSHGNPVDIIGDAPGPRYHQALEILTRAEGVDAVLVMHAPTAIASSDEAARAIVDAAKNAPCNVLTCWVGEEAVSPARRMFRESGLPTFETPTRAIGAFMHMVEYQRNQDLLIETPSEVQTEFSPRIEIAKSVFERAFKEDRNILNEAEAKEVLAAYGLPIVRTLTAATPNEAAEVAKQIKGPYALKILSKDITHKSDSGGVRLGLETPDGIRSAAETMLKTVQAAHPDAHIDGFTVQQMASRPGAQEIIVGVTTDPIFGPVILFGHGGTEVEIVADRAVALPPLNMSLAMDLIRRTRIYKLLQGYRGQPPADLKALCLVLIQISQMIVDLRDMVELDINPLFVDHRGVLAVDARIGVRRWRGGSEPRLAIRPYPRELEESFKLRSGREVLLRPIRPEDEPAHYEFLSKLTPEDIRFRFFGLVKELPHTEMARLTQIDYDRQMAFIATAPRAGGGGNETLGVVRTATDPNNERTEFAIVVRSDLKDQKLGWKLLDKMIEYSRSRGTKQMVGQVLLDNRRMLQLAEHVGFRKKNLVGEGVAEVTLDLEPPVPEGGEPDGDDRANSASGS